MSNVVVLGAGLVGSLIIKDLKKQSDLRVKVIDSSERNLSRLKDLNIEELKCADLSNKEILVREIQDADVVVGALPGFMGFETIKTVIKAGKNIVDISFMSESALELNELAIENNVTAIFDCGVSPGISNLLIGRWKDNFDQLDDLLILVGGLPKRRVPPFEYRVVFSISDLIEEYVRPARYREDGKMVTREALTDIELIKTPIGTLEAFNSDGLRSLLDTLDIPNLKEKTLRYPGHSKLMESFRESGFFSAKSLDVKGQSVVPLEFTTKLLEEQLRFQDDDRDITYLQVTMKGKKDGQNKKAIFEMVDSFDVEKNETSMARTTGYPCSIMSQMVARNEYVDPGVKPLDLVSRDNKELYSKFIRELELRKIVFSLHQEGI